jgi:hypothetical protein
MIVVDRRNVSVGNSYNVHNLRNKERARGQAKTNNALDLNRSVSKVNDFEKDEGPQNEKSVVEWARVILRETKSKLRDAAI